MLVMFARTIAPGPVITGIAVMFTCADLASEYAVAFDPMRRMISRRKVPVHRGAAGK